MCRWKGKWAFSVLCDAVVSLSTSYKGFTLKIVICTKKDLAGCLALNRLLAGLAGTHDVSVVLSDYVLTAEKSNPYASCVVAHERDKVLDHIFPFLDSLFPSGSSAADQTYAGLKARYGLSIELWGPMRSPQAFAAMKKLAPDVVISCRYDYIFSEDVIALPRFGIYGLHPGELPALQGLCSPFRAMERGDVRSGCTLFQLDPGLDTGPIVDIGWSNVAYDRSLLWNFVQTYFAGIDTLMRYLPGLEAGMRLSVRPQEPSARQYFSYPDEDEFRAFIQRGGNLVLSDDYLELLSGFLPNGLRDEHMPELVRLVSSLSC